MYWVLVVGDGKGFEMRKKSHISLAWYLMNSQGMESLKVHKNWFYFGSILPDCVPSFLVRRHSYEDSFPILEKEVKKLIGHYNPQKGITSYCSRRLGVITHYISDYFTFPHNNNYPGGLAEHCSYEEDLKHALRRYVHSDEAKRARQMNGNFKTTDEILSFVRQMHDEYMKIQSAVQRDCEYIVTLCHRVVDALLQFLSLQADMAVA